MKTKTFKRSYIKMLKFKIKQDENTNKMKLKKRFSTNIEIAKNLDGIVVNGNVAVAFCWNGNSETWNKWSELNLFWFWEKTNWLNSFPTIIKIKKSYIQTTIFFIYFQKLTIGCMKLNSIYFMFISIGQKWCNRVQELIIMQNYASQLIRFP